MKKTCATKRHKKHKSRFGELFFCAFYAFLWLVSRQQIHGEGGEPVFTCVVAAGDVSEGG